MLNAQDNDFVTRIGPATPMGSLMRRYWIPAMLSSELPAPDCPPVRVLLLGEKLIAFRDSNGRVGLLENACPHRGTSLFFGCIKEGGLRCAYHGWKFDVDGKCLDMPNEPAHRTFKDKVRAVAYPCRERGGVVWAWMGGGNEPPLPDIEANTDECQASAVQRGCNWLQAMEGDIDTAHVGFLHFGCERAEGAPENTFRYYALNDRAPRYAFLDTDYGIMYGAYRPAGTDRLYWRIGHFLFPFFTMTPTGLLGRQRMARAWVPMDDENTMLYTLFPRLRSAVTSAVASGASAGGAGHLVDGLLPNESGWYGRFRPRANEANDYELDRQSQQEGREYSGIHGIATQDQAATESMGSIVDRTREHLGSSDEMVIRVRRRLIAAARGLRDRGIVPPGALDPDVYRQRSGGVILDAKAEWVEATSELRKPYVQHPDLDPAIIGGLV